MTARVARLVKERCGECHGVFRLLGQIAGGLKPAPTAKRAPAHLARNHGPAGALAGCCSMSVLRAEKISAK